MAAAATPMEIDEFINGALVSWLESCLPRSEILTGYTSLLDGNVIHCVWLQIDPEPQHNPTEIGDLSGISLCVARAKNFETIVRNLKLLFEEELGQTLLVLPDAYTLGYHPETKSGLEQMKILLTLLLGAAVQCPNKELFIARIKELDVETQHQIVELIKQVTDNQSLVLTEDAIELLTPTALYHQLLRLTKERDGIYIKWINSICTEPDINLQCNVERNTSLPLSPASGMSSSTPSSSNSESNHMAVELADLKSKLRKIRQELEEKTESQLEIREELEHKNAQFEKLRLESQEWYAEAKRAAAYRDENDVLKERAERADRLEIEVQKFREKLTDAEFYKTRVEELREDNRLLLETKEMLEDQLQHARKRSEHVMILESEIIKYKQKLNDVALERDVDRSKLEELLEENIQLQMVAKNLNTTQELDKSLSDSEDDCNSGDNSLSEQLTNNAQTRAIKLELENRRLLAALDQLKESSFHESTNKILDLEKDKKRLSLKIEQLQENIQRMSQQNTELENVFKNALDENKKLQDTLDNRQKSYDRQSLEREVERTKLIDLEKEVETLNKEKHRIQTLNVSIQRRAYDLERLVDTRTKEVEQCSEKMQQFDKTKETVYDLEAKVSNFERENCSLSKEITKLKECLEEKSVQLDESTIQLETQTKELVRLAKNLTDVEHMQLKLVDLEKQNQDLVSQRDIDLETIATLRNDLVSGTLATNKVRHNFEKLGITVDENDDATELNVETVVEKLVRNPETFKTVREIMLNVSREHDNCENAKSDMCVLCHRKEIFTVEKNIELSGSEAQELNFEHKIVRISPPRDKTELTRIAVANTQLNALNTALQSTNEQLQAESARLQVDVATLSSQITSLNTQHVALQLANSQLAADKDVLLKQIEAMQQEHKNALHDQVTLQCLHDQLSAEYESLNKGKEQLKTIMRDLRNESREQRERICCLEEEIGDLTKQNTTMKTCTEDLAILRTEHSKLTDDFRNLFATSDRFKNEYKNIQEQYKMIRMENSKLKLQNTELSGELNAKSDQLRMLEIEYNNLVQRCESLLQTNEGLDMDRRTLMDNVSKLLSQYHELLSHSLEDKQHFHEEEKSYAERLHNLSRQKEKLEEKIMEQYKKFENTVPKKKPFAISFVRRVKKASSDLINKVPSRNRRSWVDDTRLTQSQFMIGSESGGNDSDNSTEDHNSIMSDTHIMQRNIPLRQSLQRDLLDNSLVRGGIVRSSLQAQQQQHHSKRLDLNNSRRNSVHGLEAPDVTGSSLTLGTAGSRRTVYLIDENQKLPDTNATADTAAAAATTAATAPATATVAAATITTTTTSASAAIGANLSQSNNIGAAEPQTPTNLPTTPIVNNTNNNNNSGSNSSNNNSNANGNGNNNSNNNSSNNNGKADNPAATFLMYNRIHTTIGGSGGIAADSNNATTLASGSGSGNREAAATPAGTTQDDKLLRKRSEDKSNSVWYEYGCV